MCIRDRDGEEAAAAVVELTPEEEEAVRKAEEEAVRKAEEKKQKRMAKLKKLLQKADLPSKIQNRAPDLRMESSLGLGSADSSVLIGRVDQPSGLGAVEVPLRRCRRSVRKENSEPALAAMAH
eukprot:1059335-Rhodomonas_salina.3